MRVFGLIFLFVAVSAFSQTAGGIQKLVDDERFVVSYQVIGDDVVFTMEDLRSGSAGPGAKTAESYFGISVDVNGNGLLDPGRDIGYGRRQNTKNICSYYLISASSSTHCGAFGSRATYKVASQKAEGSTDLRLIHTFTIPRLELIDSDRGAAYVVFHCVSQGEAMWTPKAFYPAVNFTFPDVHTFDKTIRIQF